MNNSFQSPLQVIQTKSQEGWSGCVEVMEPQDSSVSWQVYLLQGKIQYINLTTAKQSRLNYLWQQFKVGGNCPKLETKKQKISEYDRLCNWLAEKQFTPEKSKKVLFLFIREGLINVLSIKKAQIQLNPAKRIKKAIISFELKKLIANDTIKFQIEAWQKIRKYLHSLPSRLYLEQKDALKFYKIWKELYTKPELKPLADSQKLSSFVSLFVAKGNLYEIATKAKVDTFFLVKYLQEPIEENILQQLPFSEAIAQQKFQVISESKKVKLAKQEKTSKPTKSERQDVSNLIVCIDDSKTVQKQVKMTLEAAGYQVIGILDPTMALKDLAQHNPSVIFMDINMPDINGYDLCALLRKSHKFKDIPIVMLTGRDGMIDRVRAKIAGANDYLTKPCDPNKLIALAKILQKSFATVQ